MKNGQHQHSNPAPFVWAGTEQSLAEYLSLDAQVQQAVAAAAVRGDMGAEEEDDDPHLLSKQGGIGVVSIRGPLTNRDSPWNALFGITSYNDIRRAMIAAASDSSIRAVLLDIESGGGAVSGVADTADLISKVDREVKPVYAYSGDRMASAAMWLGASARKIFNGQLATLGSVGILATHMDHSKQLKAEGITPTIIRAGKYKALANPLEPLSDDGKDQIQAEVDTAYSVFIGHVAKSRGMTAEDADRRIGQGRLFYGQAAVDAGLSDGVSTFDAVVGAISKKHIDSDRMSGQNSGKHYTGLTMKPKTALTDQQVAAILSGASAEAVAALSVPVAPTAPVVPAAPVAQASEPATEPTPEPTAEPTAAVEPAAPVAAPVSAQPPADVVAFLQSQVAAANETIVGLRVELRQAGDAVTSMKAMHDPMLKIVANSVTTMKVALGLPKTDLSALTAEALLAEHATTSEAFEKAFKAGGVAAAAPPEVKPVTPAVDPNRKARLLATGFHK